MLSSIPSRPHPIPEVISKFPNLFVKTKYSEANNAVPAISLMPIDVEGIYRPSSNNLTFNFPILTVENFAIIEDINNLWSSVKTLV